MSDRNLAMASDISHFLVAEDTLYLAEGVLSPRIQPILGHIGLVITPILSMYVIESSRWASSVGLSGAPDLKNYQETLGNARQRIKLLVDAKREFDDVRLLAAEIVEINQGWFQLLHNGPLAFIKRRIQKDLGLFFVNGRVFNTTTSSIINLGISTELMREQWIGMEEIGAFGFNMSVESGRYVAWIMGELGIQNHLSDNSSAPSPPPVGYLDLHSNRFYKDQAQILSRGDESVVVILFLLLTLTNTADLILPQLTSHRNLSLLKWRFIILYHVIGSLRRLRDEHFSSAGILSPESAQAIVNLLQDGPITTIGSLRNLRNTLVHYSLKPHIASRLDSSLAYHSLFEACANGLSPREVATFTSYGLATTAVTLENLLTKTLEPEGFL